jgi:hypothetical protein
VDRNGPIRSLLTEAGFFEVDYREFDQAEGERAALGSARYDGLSQALIAGRQLSRSCDEFAACQRSAHEIAAATERVRDGQSPA